MRVPTGNVQIGDVPASNASLGDVPVEGKRERDSRDVAARRGKAGGFQSHAEGPCRWNRHGLPYSRALASRLSILAVFRLARPPAARQLAS